MATNWLTLANVAPTCFVVVCTSAIIVSSTLLAVFLHLTPKEQENPSHIKTEITECLTQGTVKEQQIAGTVEDR